MKEVAKKFLDLFYNEGEEVCVSHNEYGYHSISQQDIKNGLIEQISPSDKVSPETITDNDIVLAAMNPVKGFRKDKNTTAYRTFLVEMDDGSLEEQKKYIDEMGLPYSYCCFSGNKSLHFGIVLDEDLPTQKIWSNIAAWILNILDKADQQTKNPTRSIRFPGNIRKNGKKMEQKAIYMGERVSQGKLAVFLNKYPEKNPVVINGKNLRKKKIGMRIGGIPRWAIKKLNEGIDESKGRNNEWFTIGMELAKAGYDFDQMLDYCEGYFDPEGDFPLSELKSILKSCYNRVNNH